MPQPDPTPPPRTALLAASLTTIAGYVDALGYLALAHIYTANMSGNSISLGMRIAQRNFPDLARRALPIAAFFLGLLASSALHRLASARRFRRSLSLMLSIEFALLLAYAITAHFLLPQPTDNPPAAAFIPLASLAALAMGLQNASLRKAGALTVHTTHITGLLLQCADATVTLITALTPSAETTSRRTALLNAAFLFSLWLLYVAGAIAAVLLLPPLGPSALIPVLALLLLWILIDLTRPFDL